MEKKMPCQGCPDRYLGCSDHCRKPDFLKWKEKQQRIRENRRKHEQMNGYISDSIYAVKKGRK